MGTASTAAACPPLRLKIFKILQQKMFQAEKVKNEILDLYKVLKQD